MDNEMPKPGPHLHPDPNPDYQPFRDRAKACAENAAKTLDELNAYMGQHQSAARMEVAVVLANAAQAYATTSLAFTQLAPPARRRPKCQHHTRVVTR